MRVSDRIVLSERVHCAHNNLNTDLMDAKQEFIRKWPWYIQT
jgi:hypothetical protein